MPGLITLACKTIKPILVVQNIERNQMPYCGIYNITEETASTLALTWVEYDSFGRRQDCSTVLQDREWINNRHKSAGRSLAMALESCIWAHPEDVIRIMADTTGPAEAAELWRLFLLHTDRFWERPERDLIFLTPENLQGEDYAADLASFLGGYREFCRTCRPKTETTEQVLASVLPGALADLCADLERLPCWGAKQESAGHEESTEDGYAPAE